MTAFTAAALAVVTFFAYQASVAPDRAAGSGPAPAESAPGTGRGPEEPSGGGNGGSEDGGNGASGGSGDGENGGEAGGPPPLPADSGEGRRVVYSLSDRRVWLAEAGPDGTGETVTGSWTVNASSADPLPGTYRVTSRAPEITGSDGVPVEHVVVFHVADDGVVFGFSSALDGSVPDQDTEERTGGIRQDRADGEAMWEFTALGLPVVVVP